MENALIYSPDLDGHRQVYAFVMANILQELGFNVIIAANMMQKTTNSFYIKKLQEKKDIVFLNTNNYEEGGLGIKLSEFFLLQNQYKIDLTVFPEADNHLPLFISQIYRKHTKLRGRVVGIFMRPFYFYREKFFLDKLRFLKHFPSRWNKDEQLFYDFFLKHFSLLDVALSIDENFVSHLPHFKWLPDVFQQLAELIEDDEKPEQRMWIDKLFEFKEKNVGKFPFFYFGTAQDRRGYDILLKLAEKKDGCFIHCGLRNDDIAYENDVKKIRSTLGNEERLFETNAFIEDAQCIKYFFKSATHLILPYKNFYGSSGVMLQALQFGIPVLTTDTGIMGFRTSKNNLGHTYHDLNFDSLEVAFDGFSNVNTKSFEKSINYYMNFQSTEQLKKVLINSFTGKEDSISQPYTDIINGTY